MICLWSFKDLPRITASDKVLRDKTFNIAKNQDYNAYERSLASMVSNFFNKKSLGSGIENEIKQDEQLARENFNY